MFVVPMEGSRGWNAKIGDFPRFGFMVWDIQFRNILFLKNYKKVAQNLRFKHGLDSSNSHNISIAGVLIAY